MPLVPYEQAIAERGATATGIAQPSDSAVESDVAMLDLAAAALRQNNIAANLPDILSDAFARLDDPGHDGDYDPLSDAELAGFERHAMRFIGSATPAETSRIKGRIRQEERDREVIAQAGGAGLAASIAAGVVDPVTLASMAVPLVGTGSRLARVGKMVGTSIALDTAQEAALHAEQELRTARESLFNIGAGALLTGALGTLATRVPRAEFNALARDAKAVSKGAAPDLGPVESTGGAARVGFGTTLDDETVAAGGETLLKSVGQISPLGRLITSPAKRSRILLQELADMPFKLKKHERGIASPDSAESEILGARAQQYDLIRSTDAAWSEYMAAPAIAGGKKLRRGEFDVEVAVALRRGDVHAEPAVRKAAKAYRTYFDQSRKELEQAGLLKNPQEEATKRLQESAVDRAFQEQSLALAKRHNAKRVKAGKDELALNEFMGRAKPASPDPELKAAYELSAKRESGELLAEIEKKAGGKIQAPAMARSTKGAASYLPRVYDHAKIRADRIGLQDALRAYFTNSRAVADAEVDNAIDATIDTISGVLRGHAQIDDGFVVPAGPLRGRVLNVPDEVLEPWLVSDINQIMTSYIRTVTPQLVLQRRFGDVEMTQALTDVRDEYNVLRARASTNDAKAAVTERMQADLRDLQAMRDRLLGTYGVPADPDSALVKTMRVFRAVNYLRLLGGQVLSSLSDAGRVVARHGLARTGAKLARLVSSPSLRKLTAKEAHRLGTALEFVLDTRSDTLADVGDELVGSKLDRVLRRETSRFSRITGMASWNAALKTLAVGLEQDAIVRAAQRGNLTGFKRAKMAELGIGNDMLERISGELNTHAKEVDGLYRANAEAWKDTEAARVYERAIRKSADTVVLTKGVGDTPLFMSTELGKTLFQFKSFGMATVNRLLVPMAQGVARGDIATINGGAMMLALGAMANATRDWAAGKEPSTDPARVAIEAFDRAGFTTYLAEPADAISGAIGGPRFGRFTSQSPFESLTGPTFGTGEDIYKTIQGMSTEAGEFDPSVKATDVYRFRKLLPYQNLFYLRRLINGLEGEFSETIGAEGAGAQSLTERVWETTPLKR
jgi:hypothetical protein